jgi:hypothetical protein
LRLFAALGAVMLAGCVGYGYPGGPGYGGGYPPGTYPDTGYPNHGYPPPGTGYGAQTVRCESDNTRTRHCDMDTRGGVFLSRRLSDTACIQGRNWGYDRRGVWVSGGCRAEFTAGRGGYGYGPGAGLGQVLRCESRDGRSRHCNAAVQRGVQLLRTLSGSPCIEGRTWGWDRSGVWVDRGCRAEFSIY